MDNKLSKKNRMTFIDIAKGIAIFLMVIGHSYSKTNFFLEWINSFHMPLFFIVTGILYGMINEKKGCLTFNFKTKAINLLLPYFIWGTLIQLFFALLGYLGGSPLLEQLQTRLSLIFTLNSSAMWFLPAMFINIWIFNCVYKIPKYNHVILILLTFIGYFLFRSNFTLVDSIFRALKYIGFIGIGFNCYKHINKIDKVNLVVLIACNLILVYTTIYVMHQGNSILDLIIFYLNGCVGSMVLICLSKKIDEMNNNMINSNVLSNWGMNSVIILCLHRFIIEVIRLIDYKFVNYFFVNLGLFEGIIIAIIVMLCLEIIFKFIPKKLYILFGKI